MDTPPTESSLGHASRQPAEESSQPLLAPLFLRLSEVQRDDSGVILPHRHHDYEVILIYKGTYRCELNGQSMTLNVGDGLVVKPGDWHTDFFEPPFPIQYLGLAFRLQGGPIQPGETAIFRHDVGPALQRFHVELNRFRPLIDGMLREGELADPLSNHVQDALLQAFFWRMLRGLPSESLAPSFLQLLGNQLFPSRLLRLFRANLDVDLSVRDMSEMMGISESTLAHTCKSLLGVSPRKAYLLCKMERARYLLANSRMTVKEVAHLLGYTDMYGFSRSFKRECGLAPSHWREERH